MTITTALIIILIIYLGAMLVFLIRDDKTTEEVQDAEVRANEVLHKAISEAHSIKTQAELSSIKHTAQDRLKSKELLTTYEHRLNNVLAELTKDLRMQAKHSEALLEETTDHLEKKADAAIEAVEKSIITALDSRFTEIDTHIKQFGKTLNEKAQKEIDSQMKSLAQSIEEYRKSKESRIDNDIEQIVSDVIKHATGKTLTLDQHHELIEEALVRAKNDHFFS